MNYKAITTVIFGLVLLIGTLSAIGTQTREKTQAAADLIVIDSMKSFGTLERPAVSFLHDKHTLALEKQGKDCLTCHETENDQLVYTFKRVSDVDKQTTLDLYHSNCIGCHEETTEAGQSSGPVECGLCHQRTVPAVASPHLVDFDKSLHFRHIEAGGDDCQSCHHGYDAASKTITYTKGEEQSCRTCHNDQPVDNALPYQTAAHQSCIGCHQQELQSKSPGETALTSVQCSSCHDESTVNSIAKLEQVPRLDRNQPNTTFVKSFTSDITGMMNAVPFNHTFHEENVASCSTCHHETLDSCENCHTLTGSKEGRWVTLGQAMHDAESEKSCVGCHAKEMQQADCKGCHGLMDGKPFTTDTDSCASCHSVPIEAIAAAKKAGQKLTVEQFHSEKPKPAAISLDSLPENLLIDVISDRYEGAYFPHRAIVETMMERIQDSALAAVFHQGENRICQSCHHNSPAALDSPPKCISCHSPGLESKDEIIPGAKAAYHRQCFDCHEAMEITSPASTDCVGCHAEK